MQWLKAGISNKFCAWTMRGHQAYCTHTEKHTPLDCITLYGCTIKLLESETLIPSWPLRVAVVSVCAHMFQHHEETYLCTHMYMHGHFMCLGAPNMLNGSALKSLHYGWMWWKMDDFGFLSLVCWAAVACWVWRVKRLKGNMDLKTKGLWPGCRDRKGHTHTHT